MSESVERLLARFNAGVEAHKAHPPRLRRDWDGFHRCPNCDPLPPCPVTVRRVLPECWEVWCRRCAFLTNTGLVAQVGSWERAMLRAGEHLADVHSPVGRVMTASGPQPPPGSVVRDDCGQRWVNSGCYPSAWMPLDREDDSESWTKVAGNYGPATVVSWGQEQAS